MKLSYLSKMGTLKAKILIIDDEKSMQEVLRILLESDGYEVTSASDGAAGISLLSEDIFDIIITDLKMPKCDGFEVLKEAQKISPDTLVIMITAFGTIESAIEAMKYGAYDYIHKPFKIDEIRMVIRKAVEKKKLKGEVSVLREKIKTTYELGNIFWKSSKMQELLSVIPKIAQSNSSVLITGESGTGKEFVANALHNLSPRKDKNLVTINCATFPEGLLESELFGHMKGSFTGASSNKQGLFEIADGGSVFLDEIAEMPINIQAKLLRVIEGGTFRRIGGISDIKVDVRVLAATNKNLENEIASGNFREDLFFRLNVIPLNIPPLRERKEDIPLLVEHFLAKFSGVKRRISANAMNYLADYQWKGNVRELENVIERSLLLTDREQIEMEDLLLKDSGRGGKLPELTREGINLDAIVEDIERNYLLDALKLSNGVKTDASRLLGLKFRSLRHRLNKYGIK